MLVNSEMVEGIVVMRVCTPRLDAERAGDFKVAALDLVENRPAGVVVDLGDLSFIDSSGLSALIAIVKKVNRPGKVCVSGASDSVNQLLRLTRLDRVMKIFPSSDEAVASLTTATA